MIRGEKKIYTLPSPLSSREGKVHSQIGIEIEKINTKETKGIPDVSLFFVVLSWIQNKSSQRYSCVTEAVSMEYRIIDNG